MDSGILYSREVTPFLLFFAFPGPGVLMGNEQRDLWWVHKVFTVKIHSGFSCSCHLYPHNWHFCISDPGGQCWANSSPFSPTLGSPGAPHWFPTSISGVAWNRNHLYFRSGSSSSSENPGGGKKKLSSKNCLWDWWEEILFFRRRIEDTEFGHSSPGMRSSGWWKQSQKDHSTISRLFSPTLNSLLGRKKPQIFIKNIQLVV